MHPFDWVMLVMIIYLAVARALDHRERMRALAIRRERDILALPDHNEED